MIKDDDKILLRFGKKVRKLRKGLKLSQGELAKLSELDRTYISGIERGVQNPSLKNIAKIASALKIKPNELLS
jgi:transcriptional regulator with XRE-family HTH domain